MRRSLWRAPLRYPALPDPGGLPSIAVSQWLVASRASVSVINRTLSRDTSNVALVEPASIRPAHAVTLSPIARVTATPTLRRVIVKQAFPCTEMR
jgi:hypothetical protein